MADMAWIVVLRFYFFSLSISVAVFFFNFFGNNANAGNRVVIKKNQGFPGFLFFMFVCFLRLSAVVLIFAESLFDVLHMSMSVAQG